MNPTQIFTTLVRETIPTLDMEMLQPNHHNHKLNTNPLTQITDFYNHTS